MLFRLIILMYLVPSVLLSQDGYLYEFKQEQLDVSLYSPSVYFVRTGNEVLSFVK